MLFEMALRCLRVHRVTFIHGFAENLFPRGLPDEGKISAILQFLGAREKSVLMTVLGGQVPDSYAFFRQCMLTQFTSADALEDKAAIVTLSQRFVEMHTSWYYRYAETVQKFRPQDMSLDFMLGDFKARSSKSIRYILANVSDFTKVFQTLKAAEDAGHASVPEVTPAPQDSVHVPAHPVEARARQQDQAAQPLWCMWHGSGTHNSDECRELRKHQQQRSPSAAPAGERSARMCELCGDPSHVGALCRARPCLICQGTDHETGVCFVMRGGGRVKRCYLCGKEGHIKRDCERNTRASGKIICYKCGAEGHKKRDCREPMRRSCFRCGKVGHIAAGCTNKVPLHKQV